MKNHIQPDNDWTTAPPATTRAFDEVTRYRLATSYIRALCLYQVQVTQMHYLRNGTKLKEYFTSSPLKWAFINLMTIARIDNQGYTISFLVSQLGCSRTQVNRIIDDSLEAGWIELHSKGKYQASQIIIDSSHEYLETYLDTIKSSNVIQTGTLYRTFCER